VEQQLNSPNFAVVVPWAATRQITHWSTMRVCVWYIFHQHSGSSWLKRWIIRKWHGM
jgi:hypothetical protein